MKPGRKRPAPPKLSNEAIDRMTDLVIDLMRENIALKKQIATEAERAR